MSDILEWDARYRDTKPEDLPWNAGGPDPDLVRLVEAGQIPKGYALDVGTGLGHDAVYLIQHAFYVVAIDLSPTAIKLARTRASANGLFGYFTQTDVRRLPMEDGYFDFVNDRGCLHVMSPEDQVKALSEIYRVLAKKGHFLLRVFSDKANPGEKPRRFSRSDLEALITPKFRILEAWEGEFKGPIKVPSWSMFLQKI